MWFQITHLDFGRVPWSHSIPVTPECCTSLGLNIEWLPQINKPANTQDALPYHVSLQDSVFVWIQGTKLSPRRNTQLYSLHGSQWLSVMWDWPHCGQVPCPCTNLSKAFPSLFSPISAFPDQWKIKLSKILKLNFEWLSTMEINISAQKQAQLCLAQLIWTYHFPLAFHFSYSITKHH